MDYIMKPENKALIDQITGLASVQKALAYIKADHENSISEQVELVQIPAPTFHEEKRAEWMVAKFKELGLTDVHIDRMGNAVGTRKGTGNGPTIVIDGHMDTVYPLDTPLTVTRDDEWIYCPGIVDDTRACVVELALIRALNDANIQTEGDLIFTGTVQEEGKGGFNGMKGFFADHPEIDAAVCLDGSGAEGIIYQSTGFKTIEVEFHGIGGHAFGAFGQVANPLHAAARAIAKISDLEVPAYPKTTYCVSNFHAGTDASIHAIVPYASIKINYRSNGQAELEALDKEIMRCIDEACKEETARWGQDTITYNVKTFCDVRAGSLGEHDPIVEATWASIEYLGHEPELLKGGPTNASIPIGNGVPAVCLGNGGPEIYCHNAAMERFPVKDTYELPQLALLVTLAVAGISGETKTILK